MSDVMKKTKALFEKELDKLVGTGEISASNLELVYKIVDILKDVAEICEKEDAMAYEDDYSGRRGYGMMRSHSYYPYMGNYTVEGSYGRGYSGESNYNRGRSNSSMKAKLHQLMNEAETDHERMMIQSWMDDLG